MHRCTKRLAPATARKPRLRHPAPSTNRGLRRLRPAKRTVPLHHPAHPPLLGFDNSRKPIYADLKNCNEDNIPKLACSTVQVYASPLQQPELNWSPFRSVLALDETGKRNGPVLTSFKPVELKQNLNLASREYFQALKAGEAWNVKDAAGHHADLVAERLFNNTDGSKTLQLAVPRCLQTAFPARRPFAESSAAACGCIAFSFQSRRRCSGLR